MTHSSISALHDACFKGNLGEVKKILERHDFDKNVWIPCNLIEMAINKENAALVDLLCKDHRIPILTAERTSSFTDLYQAFFKKEHFNMTKSVFVGILLRRMEENAPIDCDQIIFEETPFPRVFEEFIVQNNVLKEAFFEACLQEAERLSWQQGMRYASYVFALVVYLSDGFFDLKAYEESGNTKPAVQKLLRFYQKANALPMELQMNLALKAANQSGELISQQYIEPALKKVAMDFKTH